MAKDSFVTRLPGVFQTNVNQKFFSSTVDQLLSKKNSESITAFIGRREGGYYDPINTYFKDEPSKNRMNYQLEPIAVSRDSDTLENTNEVFYEDLLNTVRYYSGDISNHDRLFESDYYSFAPPINIDKFVNYQDYYWYPNSKDVPTLTISGMDDIDIETDIIGQTSYTVNYQKDLLPYGNITFDPTLNRIYRSIGSWLVDGVSVGSLITVSNSVNNNGTFTIASVSDTWLEVEEEIVTELESVLTINKTLSTYDSIIISDSARTITRTLGSWVVDGMKSGDKVALSGATNTENNNQFTIVQVTNSTLTLSVGSVLVDETIMSAAVAVTRIITSTEAGGLTFDSGENSINRGIGSWTNDGVKLNDTILVSDNINAGLFTISTINSSSIVVNEPVDESAAISVSVAIPITLSSSMVVTFPDSTSYIDKFIVENVGTSITLEAFQLLTLPTNQFEFLFWDFLGDADSGTGAEGWDTLPWEVIFKYLDKDYITIARGACDGNAWSRTNAWFHRETLNAIATLNGTAPPAQNRRANRPIIEFLNNIELFRHGRVFLTDVKIVSTTLQYDDVNGAPSFTLVDGMSLAVNDKIIFPNDPDNTSVYIVDSLLPNIVLSVFDTPANDENVFSTNGELNKGKTYYFKDSQWHLSYNQKTQENQPPLFQLYDCQGEKLDNTLVYPSSDFLGSTLFEYAVNPFSAIVDSELGFPLVFKDLGQVDDIVFNNSIETSRSHYVLNNILTEIPGYYYYKVLETADCIDFEERLENFWRLAGTHKQRVIDRYVVKDTNESSYQLSVLPFEKDVGVRLNGQTLTSEQFNVLNDTINILITLNLYDVLEFYTYHRETSFEEFVATSGQKTYTLTQLPAYGVDIEVNGTLFTNYILDKKLIKFKTPLTEGDEVEISYISRDNLLDSANGYYEIPKNLSNNPENAEVSSQSFTDFSQHFGSILLNQNTEPYRDSEKDLSTGTYILQNKASLLKSMLITTDELDVVKAMRFASQEYNRFKNKLLKTVKEMDDAGEFDSLVDFSNTIQKDIWFNEVISRIMRVSETNNTFIYSNMIAAGNLYVEENLHEYLTHLTSNFIGYDSVGRPQFKLETLVDINDLSRAIYLFKQTDTAEETLLIGKDYWLQQENEFDVIVTVNNGIITQTIVPEVSYNISLTGNTITRSSGSWITDGFAPGQIITISNSEFNNGSYYIVGVTATVITVATQTIDEQDVESVCSYYDTSLVITTTSFIDETGVITLAASELIENTQLFARVYDANTTISIPPTPTKLGIYKTFIPQIINDPTYPTPMATTGFGFIVGHDGSMTPIFGDMRDDFLLEFETRVYNRLYSKFTDSGYQPAVVLEDVLPGKFRDTNFTQETITKILKPNFLKWTNLQRMDPRNNDYFDADNLWTYNYRDHGLNESNTPGYWRGIYDFYYGTATPHITPWRMLGFASKPDWWTVTTNTGDGFTGYGIDYSSTNTLMWNDIEAGQIRRGTRQTTSDVRYARPGLTTNFMPVDSAGELLDPITIGLVSLPTDETEWERDWIFGDGSPVENSWKISSFYPFALAELFYLTKPAKFGELMWDTQSYITSIADPSQLIDMRTCKRPVNNTQLIHGEVYNNVIVIRLGYQQWISDVLLFNRKNIKLSFGDKIRALSVRLGHKFAGYTSVENVNLYMDSVSAGTETVTDLIPNENIHIKIFKGPSIADYVYSGVIVKARADGKYQLYGYDLINATFKTHPASNVSKSFEINVAGESATFRIYQTGNIYTKNEVIRYNNTYYRLLVDTSSTTFIATEWQRLSRLPVNGGVEVTYYPDRDKTEIVEFDYGHIYNNIQEVFDMLVGYGSYLENQEGWQFTGYDSDNNTIRNFVESGKQFLNWVATSWSEDSVLLLSPSAPGTEIIVPLGYPASVERTNNGIYSILDEAGVMVDPRLTTIDRNDQYLKVSPKNESVKIYYTRVSSKETEHILVLDNTTSFNDVVYNPLLASRQDKVKFSGTRTLDWFGKYEAPGYIIQDGTLVPNFENTTNSMRDYHNTEVTLDNSAAEMVARHLNGFEEQEYLTNLQISDDVQFQFYQGMIREKGTQSSIKKLLRSQYVTQDQDITVYEEWALKVSDYGATCENQRFDVLIPANKIKTDPQIMIFDTKISATGKVKEIIVVDASTIYTTVPPVVITPDPRDEGTIADASAIAVLSPDGRLCRLDVTASGSGYTYEPLVTIGFSNDIAQAVLQKEIVQDNPNDDILFVDIDDTTNWVYRPRSCDLDNLWPTTEKISYQLPNAGYVHPNDVAKTAFSIPSLTEQYNNNRGPIISQSVEMVDDEPVWTNGVAETVWVARNSLLEWAVYQPISMGSGFFIDASDQGNYIETAFEINTNPNIQQTLPNYFVLNEYKVTSESPLLYEIRNRLVRVIESETVAEVLTYRYDFVDEFDNPIFLEDFVDNFFAQQIWVLLNKRFSDIDSRNTIMLTYAPTVGDLTWIDNAGDNKWVVQQFNNLNTWETYTVPYSVMGQTRYTERKQTKLIDTLSFKNAFVYDNRTQQTVDMLPVYDPFKGLLPGQADRNIDYKTFQDPARYIFSSDEALINPNKSFGPAEIGKTWLDLSTFAYYYYEQGTNHERRNYWGRLFPESTIIVYEWTRSIRDPSNYVGEGLPKNTTDYSTRVEYDPSVRAEITVYYFWVSGKNSVPNRKNRNMSTVAVESLITNPRRQDFEWFAPINFHTNTPGDIEFKNALIFNNINEKINNRDTVLQVNYSYNPEDTATHDEWYLIRDKDPRSLVLDQHWNKMVDSLIGMTKEIAWDQPTPGFVPTSPGYGYLLVPDPTLSDAERYGTLTRPRQTWFKDLYKARKTFVTYLNQILSNIRIRTLYPQWGNTVQNANIWKWITWYAEGYSAATKISRQVQSVTDLVLLNNLQDGEVIRVYDETSIDPRFSLFVYNNEQFNEIGKQSETIQININAIESACGDGTPLTIHEEFRNIIDALVNYIFIKENLVYKNQIFFIMLRFVMSEFNKLDWAFKTSYILIEQSGQELSQTLTLEPDPFPSTISYINAVKPYHTKIRDYSQIRNAGIDLANGTATELREMIIKLAFNRVDCSALAATEECLSNDVLRDEGIFEQVPTIPWDVGAWDICPWDALAQVATYTESDEDNINVFEQIEPDQVVFVEVANLSSTINLTFTPTLSEDSPYVFINNKQYFDFILNIGTNSVELADMPNIGDVIELFDILPFDGNGFLQPHVQNNTPQELVPMVAFDNLVLTMDANPIRRYSSCPMSPDKTMYFLPGGVSEDPLVSIDITSISVFVDGILLTEGVDYTIVTSPIGLDLWGDVWGGAPCGAPYDANAGILFAPLFVIDKEVIEVCYEFIENGPRLSIKNHVDVFGNNKIYRICDNFSGELIYPVTPTSTKMVFSLRGADITGQDGVNPPSYANPGLIWVDNELVQFSSYTNNAGVVTIYSLIRGKHGTIVPEIHDDFTYIFDASAMQLLPDQNLEPEIGGFTQDQLDFLQSCPGSAIRSLCDMLETDLLSTEDLDNLTTEGDDEIMLD